MGPILYSSSGLLGQSIEGSVGRTEDNEVQDVLRIRTLLIKI